MTPLPSIQSLIEMVGREAPDDAPLTLLQAAAENARSIEQMGDELLDYFVEKCRANGLSWSEISTVLGVSKQAAHKRFSVGAPNVERFTPRARLVLSGAIEQARALGHAFAGTEHFLLALFEPAEAIAAQVLRESGLTREAVLEKFGVTPAQASDQPEAASISGEIGLSPRSISFLRHSVAESLKLGHNYVGTEHMLLGLFDDPEARAARILASLGSSYESVGQRIGDKLKAFKQAREAGAQG